MKTYKEFLKESNNSNVLIIKKGHKLFHSSVEKITLPLRVGGYDEVLWTAEDSGISQTYIPVSSSMYTSTSNWVSPVYNESDRNIQKQLGIDYDYSEVKWNGRDVSSYKSAEIFKDLYEENNKKYKEWVKLQKQYDELQKQYNENPHIIPIREELYKLKKELEIVKNEYFGNHSLEKQKNEMVNKILMDKFGYTPTSKHDYNKDYSWKLKWTVENDKIILVPASYRSKGTLFILTPKRDLKIYDYAYGRSEGDLTNVDYHKINIFQTVEENGYDGIQIWDFAQVESEGNFGHKSIGLFKDTIKDLDVDIVENVEHPNEEDFNEMWGNRDWRSKEYKKFIS